jgi:hypothetical protein
MFLLEAKQEMPDGLRSGIIVAGKTQDDETTIVFKVREYKAENVPFHKIPLGDLATGRGRINYIPIDPSQRGMKTRIDDGVRIFRERIQGALEQ